MKRLYIIFLICFGLSIKFVIADSTSNISQQQLTIGHANNVQFTLTNSIFDDNIHKTSVVAQKNTLSFSTGLNSDMSAMSWISSQMANSNISWDYYNMHAYNNNNGYNNVPSAMIFGMLGNLSFQYDLNNLTYQCNNVILGEDNSNLGPRWYIFTNMENAYLPPQYRNMNATVVKCTDSLDREQYFYFKPSSPSTINVINIQDTEQPANQVCFTGANIDFQNASVTSAAGNTFINTPDVAGNCITVYSQRNASLQMVSLAQNFMINTLNSIWSSGFMASMDAVATMQTPTLLSTTTTGNLIIDINNITYTCNNVMFGLDSYNSWWGFSNYNQPIKGYNGTKNVYQLYCNSPQHSALFYITVGDKFNISDYELIN